MTAFRRAECCSSSTQWLTLSSLRAFSSSRSRRCEQHNPSAGFGLAALDRRHPQTLDELTWSGHSRTAPSPGPHASVNASRRVLALILEPAVNEVHSGAVDTLAPASAGLVVDA